MTDVGLKEVANLKGLQTLEIWKIEVTDLGLKELANLNGLQTLEFISCKRITDAGLKNPDQHQRALVKAGICRTARG